MYEQYCFSVSDVVLVSVAASSQYLRSSVSRRLANCNVVLYNGDTTAQKHWNTRLRLDTLQEFGNVCLCCLTEIIVCVCQPV